MNQDSAQSQIAKSRQALIVGINKYEKGKTFPQLQAPVNNAKNIKDILKKKCHFPQQIHHLTKPNRKQLKDKIVRLFLPSGTPPKMALFYFSGYVLVKNDGITEIFLVTSESNPAQDDLGISLRWLKEILRSSRVEQQIIILDCCYHENPYHSIKFNLDNFTAGHDSEKNELFIFSFQKSEEVRKPRAEFQLENRCTSLTKSILIGLDRQYKNGTDNRELIKYLKGDEKRLKELGDFKRVYFGFIDNLAMNKQCQDIEKPEPQPSQSPPYKGFAYFDSSPEDAANFYGRDRTVNKLLEKISSNNFLAIIGPSGIGKSSIVRAGLVYRLTEGLHVSGSENWYIPPVFQPGEKPLNSLARAFVDPSLPEAEKKSLFTRFRNLLEEKSREQGGKKTGEVGSKITDALAELIDHAIKEYNRERVLLVVDQFEEVFSQLKTPTPNGRMDSTSEQFLFIRCLLEKLDEWKDKFSLVLVIRADFIGRCIERQYFDLGNKIQENLVTITRMTPENLEEVIVKPAEKAGIKIEPDLKDKLIQDLKDVSGNLALLQYTLAKLWQGSDNKNSLTVGDYNKLGGVGNALDKKANSAYEKLKTQNNKNPEIAQTILIKLVSQGDGTTGITRRKVLQEDLIKICLKKYGQNISREQIVEVIKFLKEHDLITIDKDIQDDGSKALVVTLAHDVIALHWKRLRVWIRRTQYTLSTNQELLHKATKWNSNQRDDSFLLNPKECDEYECFLGEYREIYEQDEEELVNKYIVVSREKINRRNTSLNILISLIIFPAFVSLILIIMEFIKFLITPNY